ncbi:MAG: hypothetical protein WC777_00375 [Candidatus Gracilibacteria bacterium]|jgi:hypothetical protein
METPPFLKALALAGTLGACRAKTPEMLCHDQENGMVELVDIPGGGRVNAPAGPINEQIPLREVFDAYGPEVRVEVEEALTGEIPYDGTVATLIANIHDLAKDSLGESKGENEDTGGEEELDEGAIAPQIFENEIKIGEDLWCRIEQEVFNAVPYEYDALSKVSMDPNCCPRAYSLLALLDGERVFLDTMDAENLGRTELARWSTMDTQLKEKISYVSLLTDRCNELGIED